MNIAEVTDADQPDSDSTPDNGPDTDGDGDIGSEDPDDNQDPDDEDDGDDAEVTPQTPPNTPAIEIVKSALDGSDLQTIMSGETANFEITVTNTGDVNLVNVVVSDPLSPDCDMMIGNLAIDESFTYTCSIDNVTESFTNIATVTGTPEDGGEDVNDDDPSDVEVEEPSNPAIEIVKSALDGSDLQTIMSGETANFEITVTNTGDVNLVNVVVSDPLSPDCDMMIGNLAVDESFTYTCSIDNVTESFTNVAAVTGTPEDGGEDVNDDDPSDVEVEEPMENNPAILIEKNDADNQNDYQTIYEGGTATFTITVTNIGNVPLYDIVVSDPLSPNCNATYEFEPLMPGDLFSYECTIDNVTESFTNIATVTATGPDSEEVEDEDESYVDVVPEPIACDEAITAIALVECNDSGSYNLTVEIEGGNGEFMINGEVTSETSYFVGTYDDQETYEIIIEDTVGDCPPVSLTATPETCIEPVECDQSITIIPNVECNEDGTYNLFAEIFGGNGDYIVNGEETSASYVFIGTFEDGAPYTISVEDVSGVCPPNTVAASPESCVKDCEELIVAPNVVCSGDGTTYEIVIAIENGTAPYTVSGTVSDMFTTDAFTLGSFDAGTGFDLLITDADDCSISISQNIVECGGLALELISFEAEAEREGNLVSWISASEIDFDYYELQKSENGHDFEQLTLVNGTGSINQELYEYMDYEPFDNTTYYRLKMIDNDGSFKLSDIVKVSRTNDDFNIDVYPNPVSSILNIDYLASSDLEKVTFYNIEGKLAYEYVPVEQDRSLLLDIEFLAEGTYLLVFEFEDGTQEVDRILKY